MKVKTSAANKKEREESRKKVNGKRDRKGKLKRVIEIGTQSRGVRERSERRQTNTEK